MRLKSNSAVFITGKKGTGKTHWIREHLKVIPPDRLYIFDFNCNDYQDQTSRAHVWNYEGAGVPEACDFMNTVYTIGNCYAVLEEADNYLRTKDRSVVRFVSTARNRGIGFMVNAKRAHSVIPDYRTCFNYLVLFHVDLPEDIDYLEKWAGTGPGSLAKLRELSLGEHIIVDLDHQTISDVKKL